MYNPGKLFSYVLNRDLSFDDCRRVSNNLLQGSKAVQSHDINKLLDETSVSNAATDIKNLEMFVSSFKHWLLSGSSRIHGLDNFEADFSAGTTQAFDSFYFRHKSRRFRCLVGEYFYHLKTWQSTSTNWSFVSETDPLAEGDAFIISLPFCDTGNLVDNYKDLLEQCTQLKIPVLVDCCYYTISSNLDIDVNYECVDTVCFSLSKAFPVANLRIGVRYTRPSIFDGQKLHHQIGYNNTISAHIGTLLINKYPPDYVSTKYCNYQEEACAFLGLVPSQSVIFGIGDKTWSQYSRKNLLDVYKLKFSPDLFANRISLNVIYENWDTFKLFKHEYKNLF